MIFQLFQFFLVLIVPGLIGALFFSIFARLTTEIDWRVAFIFDLFTFTTMIIGLYYFQDILNVEDLLVHFNCLSFTRKYILLSIVINIFYGIIFGLLRRVFFWIRRRPLFSGIIS
ncbi:hypothetical protein H0486_11100 [Lachnospiraceae bacterium MD1]|jgi:hypothetical protein|uniref:Uncharacterized protein n=1 Tax=Variimorphobacter saccharofermentans TaxID=2755051 RepID=A0A839K1C0_9FIRM|nr:hypothetical protein [Variimorphobacter saccharofermentans]MBB2183426.1 hypothetical protein [Variimorphobacter saccharofermentans]